MSNGPERTRDGLLGKVAGQAKATAGQVAGNDGLARESRLQEASVDERAADIGEAADLERRARQAQAAAGAIDPEEQ